MNQSAAALGVPRTAWTPAELAASLGVEYETVLRWIHSGRVAAIQVGNQYRVPESERLRLEQEARDEAAQRRAVS
jgi:excisionase family DNA binding protein